MRKKEAEKIVDILMDLKLPITKLLEIGGSTLEYRQRIKPHISQIYHNYFEKNGIAITTTDIKNSDGIDYVGDIMDPSFANKLPVDIDCIAINNLLEHVPDASKLCFSIQQLRKRYIIYSGPLNYPYHRDPIDNLLRPDNHKLNEIFPDYDIVKYVELETGSFLSDLNELPFLRRIVRLFREVVVFFYLLLSRINIKFYSRLMYIGRNYSCAIAVLKLKCH